MRRGRQRTGYLFACLGLVLLMLAAFFLPDMAMSLQDRQSMKEVQFTSREGLDYAAVNTEYDYSLESRLNTFAKGCAEGKQYFTASSDYVNLENKEEMIRKIWNEGVITLMEYLGIMWPDYLKDISKANAIMEEYYLGADKLQVLKEELYVIYDEDTSNSAAMLCLYLHLRLEGICDVNVLADGKDGAVYYMEVYSEIIDRRLVEWEKSSGSIIWLDTQLNWCGYPHIYDMLSKYYLFQMNFYQEEIIYDESAGVNIAGVYPEAERKPGYMQLVFPYQDGDLTMEIFFTDSQEQEHAGFCIGLKEIFELLPEENRAKRLEWP